MVQSFRSPIHTNFSASGLRTSKYRLQGIYLLSGSGLFTFPVRGISTVTAWGAGAGGAGGDTAPGGAGGAAVQKTFQIYANTTASYGVGLGGAGGTDTNGAAGGDTTLAYARSDIRLVAGGGKASLSGGVATGGDKNAMGGSTGAAVNGNPGQNGAPGGTANTWGGGGGGAGGFTDIESGSPTIFSGGAGGNGNSNYASPGSAPGGGGGGASGSGFTGAVGAPGRILILVFEGS